MMRGDPNEEKARQIIGKVETLKAELENAVVVKDIERARQAYDEAIAALNTPLLGGAEHDVASEHPEFAGIGLARRAADLRDDLDRTAIRITGAEELKKAKANAQQLVNRLQKVSEEPDLDALSADLSAFMNNPVDPSAGPDPVLANRFQSLVSQVESMRNKIDTARASRERAATTDVVRKVQGGISPLINEKKFGEALALLDEMSEEHPDANLSAQRQRVEEALTVSWNAAVRNAASFYQESISPAHNEDERADRAKRMKQELQEVVDSFGVDGVVEKAKRLMADPTLLADGPEAYLE